MESLCLALSSYRRICLIVLVVVMTRCVTGGVDEGVPDAGPPAGGCRRALDLERGRRRPEDEPLGERVPAQPARVRPRGTDAKPAAAERQEGQGQQQPPQHPAAMRCRWRSRRPRGAHPSVAAAQLKRLLPSTHSQAQSLSRRSKSSELPAFWQLATRIPAGLGRPPRARDGSFLFAPPSRVAGSVR
jgi:hypothetical protein